MIETPIWRDGHLHLRQVNGEGALLPWLANFSSRWCSEVVVMPNTIPAIERAEDVKKYALDCRAYLEDGCKPLMTIKLMPHTTPGDIRRAKEAGAVAVKVYPEGVTTNSEEGITRDMLIGPGQALLEVFEAIQEEDMILLWHGELPGAFIMDREAAFLKVFENTARNFPNMRQVLEHITTEAAVNEIDLLAADGLPVAATITMHHLWMRNGLDDVMGGLLKPDWFCKPVAKRPSDHLALLRALSHERVFLGTDSAAHPPEKKYAAKCCAGCLTAPHPEMLVHLFEEFDIMNLLVPFTSARMGAFYRLPEDTRTLVFAREPWVVPDKVNGGLVPFLAGVKLNWRLKG